MLTGVVKWYSVTKGYGFILPDDGSADVFIHARHMRQTGRFRLFKGEQVVYELDADRSNGPRSSNFAVQARAAKTPKEGV